MAMAASMTRDVEALVDLFLSPNFDPFESQHNEACRPSSFYHSAGPRAVLEPEDSRFESCYGDASEINEEDDEVEYEAAVDSDTEDETQEDACGHALPAIHSGHSAKRIGQILAKMGDELFHSYTPKSTDTAGPPWKNIGEQLKSVFIKVAQLKENDPDAEQKKQEAWQDFKAILNSAVSDNVAGDAFKLLGALLLSLRGLSEMASGIKGLAHSYFIRYIRERQLDVEMQRLGGLNCLKHSELD